MSRERLFAPCKFIADNPAIRKALSLFADKYYNYIHSYCPKFLCDNGFHYIDQVSKSSFAQLRSAGLESLRKSFYSSRDLVPAEVSIHPFDGKFSMDVLHNILVNLEDNGYEFDETWRIESLNIRLSSNNILSESVQWHRDSVGHRLHIFAYLCAKGAYPSTGCIPGSHRAEPWALNIDLVRTKYRFDDAFVHDLTEEVLCSNFDSYSKVIEISCPAILILDTNCFHNAHVPANFGHHAPGARLLIHMELMQTQSSDFANSHRLGPCAPGRSLLYFREEKLVGFKQKHLLDDNCLHTHETRNGTYKIYSTLDRLSKNIGLLKNITQ